MENLQEMYEAIHQEARVKFEKAIEVFKASNPSELELRYFQETGRIPIVPNVAKFYFERIGK